MTLTQNQIAVPAAITDAATAKRIVTQIEGLFEAGETIAASRAERMLHIAVLEGVAGSNAQAGWIAAAALDSLKLDFTRCYGDGTI